MIIETPYKSGDTVSIKLTSGEELIGRLEEEKGDQLTIRKPLMVAATQQGLGLAPFMFTISAEAKVNIGLSKVVCVTKTHEDFAKQYVESTSNILT